MEVKGTERTPQGKRGIQGAAGDEGRSHDLPKSSAKQLQGSKRANGLISLQEIVLAAVEEMHWRRGTQVGKRGTYYWGLGRAVNWGYIQ